MIRLIATMKHGVLLSALYAAYVIADPLIRVCCITGLGVFGMTLDYAERWLMSRAHIALMRLEACKREQRTRSAHGLSSLPERFSTLEGLTDR